MARPRSEDKRNAILSAAIETLLSLVNVRLPQKLLKLLAWQKVLYLPILVIKKNYSTSYIFHSRPNCVRS